MKLLTPLKAIRANCLECCDSSAKAVAYCTCDGKNSTACVFWPYRFGKRPETAAQKYGAAMLNPAEMPGPGVLLESLPTNPREWAAS
jgi:hypothetical protein